MAFINQAAIDALKAIKFDSGNFTDAEIAQLKPTLETLVATQNTELTTRVTEAEADLKRINDALVDPNTTPEQTTEAIGDILGVTPVNA